MKQLRDALKKGKSKVDAHSEWIEAGGDPKKSAKYLASFPDQVDREKYRSLQIAFLCLYGLFALAGVVSYLPALLSELPGSVIVIVLVIRVAIPAAIIWEIARGRVTGYFVFILLALLGMSQMMPEEGLIPLETWIDFGLTAVLIIFAVIVKTKIYSFQNLFHSKKNEDGCLVFTSDLTDASRIPSGSGGNSTAIN